MRTTLIVLALGVALAAPAAPVLAQDYTDHSNVQRREDDLRGRIEMEVRRGDIGGDQAETLRSELRQIVNLDRRYTHEGMGDEQLSDLDSRLDLLDSRLNYDVSMNRNGRDDHNWRRYGAGYNGY